MARVAFLGLGVMGYPMAGHLKAAGHDVTVYNRTATKAEAWVAEHGGAMAATPREAVAGAEVVMACVGNDDDLRAVCLGPDGAFGAMQAGGGFFGHTTGSAQGTARLYSIAQGRGGGLLRWPRYGGARGAGKGAVWGGGGGGGGRPRGG
ncbi:MAG: NAD(P)-dependent oxidoreductase, partial [Aestuariivita sp.]|nr:NAD(P)-dependent oxidoreductase [Aestuariivita sp.]